MPWCPKCKTEYREGFYKCSDCNVSLVDELEVEDEIVIPQTNSQSWAFLIKTYNDKEALIIESLLGGYGIPVLRKEKGAGGYLKIVMGMTNLGIDLYVPDSALEEARVLIETE